MFDEHLSSPNRSCEFSRRNFGTGRVRHFYSRTSARKGYSYLTCYQRIVGYIFQCIRTEQDTHFSVSGISRIHILVYQDRTGYTFQCIREEYYTYSRVSERSKIHILVYQEGVGYIFQCIRDEQDTYSSVSGRSRIHILVYQG